MDLDLLRVYKCIYNFPYHAGDIQELEKEMPLPFVFNHDGSFSSRFWLLLQRTKYSYLD